MSLDQLRVGMYTQLGDITCAPAVRRAVTEAAEALRSLGASVEPFGPPDVAEAWRLCAQVLHADGFSCVRRAVKGSTVDWRIRQAIRLARVPTWLRPAAARLLELAGQHHLGQVFRLLPRRAVGTPRYLELVAQQRAYRQRFDRALRRQGLDVILCPTWPSPAILHGQRFVNLALIYTALYNLLGLPAGVVSITRVREQEQTDRAASGDWLQRAAFACRISQCRLARRSAGRGTLVARGHCPGRDRRAGAAFLRSRRLSRLSPVGPL